MTIHPLESSSPENRELIAPPQQPRERAADEALVRTLCDHEALWASVDAGAARALFAWQVANATSGVVDLEPLYRYVVDVHVDALAAAVFVVDLAGELDRIDVVGAVPAEVDDILDDLEILDGDDPRFARTWQ
jgi:hypothetical protein